MPAGIHKKTGIRTHFSAEKWRYRALYGRAHTRTSEFVARMSDNSLEFELGRSQKGAISRQITDLAPSWR